MVRKVAGIALIFVPRKLDRFVCKNQVMVRKVASIALIFVPGEYAVATVQSDWRLQLRGG